MYSEAKKHWIFLTGFYYQDYDADVLSSHFKVLLNIPLKLCCDANYTYLLRKAVLPHIEQEEQGNNVLETDRQNAIHYTTEKWSNVWHRIF